jgi:hypothetical protein
MVFMQPVWILSQNLQVTHLMQLRPPKTTAVGHAAKSPTAVAPLGIAGVIAHDCFLRSLNQPNKQSGQLPNSAMPYADKVKSKVEVDDNAT